MTGLYSSCFTGVSALACDHQIHKAIDEVQIAATYLRVEPDGKFAFCVRCCSIFGRDYSTEAFPKAYPRQPRTLCPGSQADLVAVLKKGS